MCPVQFLDIGLLSSRADAHSRDCKLQYANRNLSVLGGAVLYGRHRLAYAEFPSGEVMAP